MRRSIVVHFTASLILISFFVSCASDSSYKHTVTSLDPNDPIYERAVVKVRELVRHLGGAVERPQGMEKATVNKVISYHCESMASISNNPAVLYQFDFDENLKINAFKPKGFFLDGIKAGMGYDLLNDNAVREKLIKVVSDFNGYFGIKYYDGPFIQTFSGNRYLVTFHSETKETIEKLRSCRTRRIIFHPYVSFLVTKDMKVFGVFWGT